MLRKLVVLLVISISCMVLVSASLSVGTNVGFVSTAPTSDPNGAGLTADNSAYVQKSTSSSTATKITEIGWYLAKNSDTSNYEVGLYEDSGGVAGNLLEVSRTQTNNGVMGWKSVSVDWDIDPSTDYWLAFQLDNVAIYATVDRADSGGPGYDVSSISTLPSPFNGGALYDSNGMVTIYAVWSEGEIETYQHLQLTDSHFKINSGHFRL